MLYVYVQLTIRNRVNQIGNVNQGRYGARPLPAFFYGMQMLFQSTVPQLFNKLNFDFYTAATSARKKECAKRLNLYHDSQLPYLEEKLSELFAEPDRMLKIELNITRKVINNLAQIYRVPPIREIEGAAIDKELYKQICQGCTLDVKLKQASRYAKLLKSILLKVVWRNGRLDLDILTGNILDIEIGETPEDLKKVLITDFGKVRKDRRYRI